MTFNDIVTLIQSNPFTPDKLKLICNAIEKTPDLLKEKDDNGNTIALHAARYGRTAVIKHLHEVKRYSFQEENSDGRTVWLLAIVSGQIEMVQYLAINILQLLSHDKRDKYGSSALSQAVFSENTKLFDYLLTIGYQISSEVYQLLLDAAYWGKLEMYKHLLTKGWNPQESQQKSIVRCSVQSGKTEMFSYLVDTLRYAYYNPDHYSSSSDRPLLFEVRDVKMFDYLWRTRRFKISSILPSQLLEYTILQFYTREGRCELIEHLVKHVGSRLLDEKNSLGEKAIAIAKQHNRHEGVAYCLVLKLKSLLEYEQLFDDTRSTNFWKEYSPYLYHCDKKTLKNLYLPLIQERITKILNEQLFSQVPFRLLIAEGWNNSVITPDDIVELIRKNHVKLSSFSEELFLLRKNILHAIIKIFCKETAIVIDSGVDTQTTLLGKVKNLQSQKALNELIEHCIDQIKTAISTTSPFNSSRTNFKIKLEKFQPILCPEAPPIPINVQYVVDLKEKLIKGKLPENEAKEVMTHIKTCLSRFSNAAQLYVAGKPVALQIPQVNEERACANYAKVLLLNNDCWNDEKQTPIQAPSSATSSASFSSSLFRLLSSTSPAANISTPQPTEKGEAEKKAEIIGLLDESLKYSDYCYLPVMFDRLEYIDLTSEELTTADIKLFIQLNLEIFIHPLSTSEAKQEANDALIKLKEIFNKLKPEKKQKIDIATLEKMANLNFVNLEDQISGGKLCLNELGDETLNNLSASLRNRLGYSPKVNVEVPNVFLKEITVPMPVEAPPSVVPTAPLPASSTAQASLPQEFLAPEVVSLPLSVLPYSQEKSLPDVVISDADKIAELIKVNDSLKAENAELKVAAETQNHPLKTENSELKAKVAAQEEELAELQKKLAQQQEELVARQTQIFEITGAMGILAKYAQLPSQLSAMTSPSISVNRAATFQPSSVWKFGFPPDLGFDENRDLRR